MTRLFSRYRFVVPPSQPTANSLGPAIENKAKSTIARCATHGFKPKYINVTWSLQGEIGELDDHPTITEIDSNAFSMVSFYSRTFDRTHNGRILTCNVNHMAMTQAFSTSVAVTILCRFLCIMDLFKTM